MLSEIFNSAAVRDLTKCINAVEPTHVLVLQGHGCDLSILGYNDDFKQHLFHEKRDEYRLMRYFATKNIPARAVYARFGTCSLTLGTDNKRAFITTFITKDEGLSHDTEKEGNLF